MIRPSVLPNDCDQILLIGMFLLMTMVTHAHNDSESAKASNNDELISYLLISFNDPGANFADARRGRALLASMPRVLELPQWQPLIAHIRNGIHYGRVPNVSEIQIGDQLSPYPRYQALQHQYLNAFYDYDNTHPIALYALRMPATQNYPSAEWMIAWLHTGVGGVVRTDREDGSYVIEQTQGLRVLRTGATYTYTIVCDSTHGVRSVHRHVAAEEGELMPWLNADSIHGLPSFYRIHANVIHPEGLNVAVGYGQYTREEAEGLEGRVLSLLPPPETCRDNAHFPWPPRNGP